MRLTRSCLTCKCHGAELYKESEEKDPKVVLFCRRLPPSRVVMRDSRFNSGFPTVQAGWFCFEWRPLSVLVWLKIVLRWPWIEREDKRDLAIKRGTVG